MEKKHLYSEIDQEELINKALHWANTFSHFSFHSSNNIQYPHQGFESVLAIGCKKKLQPNSQDDFQALKELHNENWLFGYLGYDLKNQLEKLESTNPDLLGFPDINFFEPIHLLFFEDNSLRIKSNDELVLEKILAQPTSALSSEFSSPSASVSRNEYIKVVNALKDHIVEGDCYEINYCQEFHGDIQQLNAVDSFLKLNKLSPKPFSCFQKFENHFILCASPERFLKKSGEQIISQPIKGTRPRSTDPAADEAMRLELRKSEKEIAENMMIVDLVRNDLARTSISGSVKVEELFGIYSFEQVHQMISTITAIQEPQLHFTEVIKNAFPMGSMTGAPKVKVMELIEHYENTKRGAFSGASGYIKPNGDFDFNVLIRTLFLNQASRKYSFQVGSAITYDALAEEEYEECLVKAKALLSLLKESPDS